MPAYKDEKKGTWFVQCSYRDYTGSRIRTTKRGFSTRREALRWEKEFILKKEGPEHDNGGFLRALRG